MTTILNPQLEQLAFEVNSVRESFGYATEDSLSVLKISGKDAESFLQAQTTNDLMTLEPGQGQYTALLDRKGLTQAYFILQKQEDNIYWITAPSIQIDAIQTRLEQFLFTEDVTFKPETNYCGLWVQGPETRVKLDSILSISSLQLPQNELDFKIINGSVITQWPISGEDGFLIWQPLNQRQEWVTSLTKSQCLLISHDALNTLRIEAGIPFYGVDFNEETLLPATGLQQVSVSYTKGCFQGQEVVAKVKTYGSVGKSLVGLILDNAFTGELLFDSPVLLDTGETIGQIKSTCYSPTLKNVIAFAYLNRESRVPNKELNLQLNGNTVKATVVLLPFYTAQNNIKKAEALYEEALKHHAENNYQQAENNLRQAIILNPNLFDAYEVLGVILSRQEGDKKLDEAISLMEKLIELTPDEIMPHTNLSIFYAKKGLIEEAEVEKAKATTLAFKKALAEKQQQVNEAELEAKRIQDLENKAQMFKAVLEDDPEDGLANFGLGQVLNQLRKYEESIPYLLKSRTVQPQHSLTYVNLGQAYEGTQQPELALEVYQAGLEVATKKGDLMPLKQIQGRLEAIH